MMYVVCILRYERVDNDGVCGFDDGIFTFLVGFVLVHKPQAVEVLIATLVLVRISHGHID